MAPEKVTEMILNVDLKCSGCYKKVKKVICKIPQIRDQMFDVEKNKVKIIVVCCSPEKIRDKLCYKGGGAIQSIEIIEKAPADKPKPPADKPKPPADKPKPPADKPPEKPKPPADKPPKMPDQPPPVNKPKPPADKPQDGEKPKDASKKADAGPRPDGAKMVYEPVHGYPQLYPPSAYPMVGYGQYYDQGYGGAPFQHGYGMPIAPPPPPPSYGGFGYDNGYNGYNGYNGNRNHYGGEEDGEGCSIM